MSTVRRARLGVDFHTFDGIFQGSRSHLLGLYRAAIVLAPDVDFYFFLEEPERLRQAWPEFALPHVHLVSMPHRPGVWRLLWQLAALQRRYQLDLLHVQYRLPLLPLGPCICTMHDVLFETHPQYFSPGFVRIARWSARHAVQHAALTLTVSEYSAEQIALLYALPRTSVVLTPNAVDGTRFYPSTANAGGLEKWGLCSQQYWCCLGRLEPRKNHLQLIRAYARLPAQVPPLIIIGQRDFSYAGAFAAVQELGLQERVRFLENVDDAALPLLLRHARLMVYPSLAEGFGMPVLEALASGVPVITSNTTSLPEVAGPAAWCVSPDAVDPLVQAMLEAWHEPPTARAQRIALGLEHARRFNWQASAAALLDGVKRVCGV